jgi:hypothetical protein
LAAQGYKQFWFSMAMVRSSTGFKDEAGADASTDLKDSEFNEVKDHITSNLGKPVAKKRLAPKEHESQEKKRKRVKKKMRGMTKMRERTKRMMRMQMKMRKMRGRMKRGKAKRKRRKRK